MVNTPSRRRRRVCHGCRLTPGAPPCYGLARSCGRPSPSPLPAPTSRTRRIGGGLRRTAEGAPCTDARPATRTLLTSLFSPRLERLVFVSGSIICPAPSRSWRLLPDAPPQTCVPAGRRAARPTSSNCASTASTTLTCRAPLQASRGRSSPRVVPRGKAAAAPRPTPIGWRCCGGPWPRAPAGSTSSGGRRCATRRSPSSAAAWCSRCTTSTACPVTWARRWGRWPRPALRWSRSPSRRGRCARRWAWPRRGRCSRPHAPWSSSAWAPMGQRRTSHRRGSGRAGRTPAMASRPGSTRWPTSQRSSAWARRARRHGITRCSATRWRTRPAHGCTTRRSRRWASTRSTLLSTRPTSTMRWRVPSGCRWLGPA